MPYYTDIILPVPLEATFTYHIPEGLQGRFSSGMRVIVPFGPRKFYTGIVDSVHQTKPEEFQIKDVASVLDTHPIIRNIQLRLWRWISEYYLCPIGDVMRAALPSGLKVENETTVECNPDMDADEAASVLSERELSVWQILDHKGKMNLQALAKETSLTSVGAVTNRMIEKGALIISERLVERFKPKKERYVRLTIPRGDNQRLHQAFETVHRSPRQEHLLQTMVEMSGYMQHVHAIKEVRKADLLGRASVTSETVNALVKKGLVEEYVKEVSRFKYDGPTGAPLPTLSTPQNEALREIHACFRDHAVTLLHGVTSSGKTEIYMHLIDFVLKQGRQVLYLVPEIALTTQLTVRLQKVFGSKVVIYHSRFSDAERVEVWQKILHGKEPSVIIGARSSVFLPFAQLGLVIVDEEHEPSYKQYDPAPRYNGRDTAIVLAGMHGAKTLLGSATPTVETYYKAQSGKYGLVTLSERYAGARLPQIEVVDMQKERQRKSIQGPFALSTLKKIRQTINDHKQVILFQNRRGYAPVARCRHCSYIPKCIQCDVSLTYHQRIGKLVCHYCSREYPMPETCPVCKEPGLEIVGFGTERVEENIEENLKDARIIRMDLDTTRNKESYSNLIDTFSAGEADVLVGTQMVTKGLDFAGVRTVVVMDADSIISYPDFRSAERAFNMLEQVGGRAGRSQEEGTVIVQTRNPEHPVIRHIQEHDYQAYYEEELTERSRYNYPPFSRVIYLYLRHRDSRKLDEVAERYCNELRYLLGNRVYGPQEPVVARVQNMYIRRIMLKVEQNASLKQIKELLRSVYVKMHKNLCMRGVTVHYDVDPW